MKLLMIHVWNADELAYRNTFSGLMAYPSLTLASIIPLVPESAFSQIDIIDEQTQRVNYDKEKYDIVMLSFDTASAVSAYRHAKAFRKRGAYIVGGGYHATAMPEEAAKYCDTVISGPAERAVPAFFRDYLAGSPKPFYRDTNLCAADYPVPQRKKIPMHGKLRIPAVIADRGCKNACKYCAMRTMWPSDPRPIKAVMEEIRSLHTKMLIFYDPNFFQNRDYAIRLMRALKPLHLLWACTATADLGNDTELLKIASDCGLRAVVIGLESMNVQSLKSVAKQFPDADRYKALVANIHKYGIAVNGCFVLGLDHDTEKDLRKLPDYIEYLGLDLCRFSILTPYPGTRLYREMEESGRLLTKKWNLYDQQHTVFRPKHFTPEQLNRIYREVSRDAYSWKRIFRRLKSSPWRHKPYLLIQLGANIGFRYLGIDKRRTS